MSKRKPSHDTPREEKQRQFTHAADNPLRRFMVPVGIIIGFIGLVAYGISASLREDRAAQATATTPQFEPAPSSTTGQIRIPLAQLAGGRARFFEQAASHGRFRFFAMLGSDGLYRAALDACEICYEGRQGYTQRGDEMVCRKCGQSFPSALINEVSGGCHPIGVPRKVESTELVINLDDLTKIDAEHALRSRSAR